MSLISPLKVTLSLNVIKITFYPLIWVVLVVKSRATPQSSAQYTHLRVVEGLYWLGHEVTQF